MKCDERGDIFVTGPGGLWIFTPDGEHIGNIEVPKGVGNFAWGGDDYRTLFIGAWTHLFRLPTRVASHREPYM
jgi:gluconolactonase